MAGALTPTTSALTPTVGPLRLLTGPGGPPQDDVDIGPALLQDVASSGVGGWLRVYRPAPAVAFSRRDTLTPGFRRAVATSAGLGFTPVLRAPGGRAAAYHEEAICLELVVADPDPRTQTTRRFVELAELLVRVLVSLGVDARVGAVPDEYCPGRHSVNGGGRVKLAGTAQRVVRGGWFLGAVLLVDGAGPVREVIGPVYEALGLSCDVRTVGSVREVGGGIGVEDVVHAVLTAFDDLAPLLAADLPVDWRRRAGPQHPDLPAHCDPRLPPDPGEL